MKKKFRIFLHNIALYNKIANISQISRRYIALNGFDGVITIIGVVLGNYIISANEYKHVIITGCAVCISLLVSGVWSAYNSESAERAKEIHDLELSTLHLLNGTIISRAQKFAIIVLSAVNGVSSGISAFIPIIPFFFGNVLQINTCYYLSAALAFFILFALGLFLGKVSKQNIIISIIKMIFAGVFCISLGYLLSFID